MILSSNMLHSKVFRKKSKRFCRFQGGISKKIICFIERKKIDLNDRYDVNLYTSQQWGLNYVNANLSEARVSYVSRTCMVY